MEISIKTNFPEVHKRLLAMREDIAARALVSAVNKTAERAKTQMIRGITDEFNVSATYVRDRLRIRFASFAKASSLGVTAVLVGGNGKRSANVIAFGARQAGRGVSVKIKKAGPRKIITGAFIGNAGRTVFQRVGKKRLPIRAVQTIDVPQMFNQKKINAAVVDAIKDKFPAIFDNEAKFYIARFNRGA